jgi:hypothetical protein
MNAVTSEDGTETVRLELLQRGKKKRGIVNAPTLQMNYYSLRTVMVPESVVRLSGVADTRREGQEEWPSALLYRRKSWENVRENFSIINKNFSHN